VLLLISFASRVYSQVSEFNFIRSEQGIQQEGFICIYEDKLGFKWLGTSQGLYLFNGIDYVLFRYQPGNDNSLCNNNISKIIEDEQGDIWIGTISGLSRYNRRTGKYRNYFHNEKDSTSISNDQIKDFVIDRQYRLWIATANGLNLYNRETDNFRQFNNFLSGNIKIGRSITCMQSDNYGYIWLGTWNAGLIRFSYEKNEFLHFQNDRNDPHSIRSNQIYSLACINDSTLWFGHYENGLGEINLNSLDINYRLFDESRGNIGLGIRKMLVDHEKNVWMIDESKLKLLKRTDSDLVVFADMNAEQETIFPKNPGYLYEDSNNIIWVYSNDDGLLYFHHSANNFQKYYCELPSNLAEHGKNYVKSFVEDNEGNLWIGCWDNGVVKISKDRKKHIQLNVDAGNLAGTPGSNRVNHLLLDNAGKIWMSTSNGIKVINPSDNQIEKKVSLLTSEKDGLFHPFVNKVFQDSRGNFWIITQEGLDFYNPVSDTFRHFNQGDIGGFSHYKFTTVAEDNDGNLWFGTYKGLNRYNLKTGEVKQFFHNPSIGKTISNSYILCLSYIKGQDKLWIGTQDGLNMYVKGKDEFITYSGVHGFSNTNISGILYDDSLHLWLITNAGLSKFNLNTTQVLNYGAAEGLSINIEAFYKSKEGKYYFGGLHNNYYSFYSDDIKFNAFIPPVYLTDFLLFNKSTPVSTEKHLTALPENIMTAKELRLQYNQNSFGFEFTALNYLFPEKNQYAYKLEGFDKDWNYTDFKRRYANYTNLSPGKYSLRVIASNNDGVWNREGARLSIIISPPYWKTIFAYIIYLLTLAALIFTARSYTVRQTRLKASLELEHLLREKEEESHKLRISFFTNTSHEFRTPLTLISGPLKQLVHLSKKDDNKEISSYLGLIQRNVKRLTELTNQLLDFRKIESGKMKLEVCQGDIVQFVSGIVSTFNEVAEKKRLLLSFSTDSTEIIGLFDPDKLEKILFNLINNAIKFTPKGKVSVKLSCQLSPDENKGRKVEISVEDTGIGIAEDQLEQIFNPFHQVEASKVRRNEGTGLGLALAQNLVQLYRGEISVRSQPGKGSCFIVIIPIDQQELGTVNLRSLESDENSEIGFFSDDGVVSVKENYETVPVYDSGQLPVLLVVEDNDDMRTYVKNICSRNYRVIEAEGGSMGVKMAVENIPDLVISDLMMPEMSGIELTKVLKADLRTSHIPVILLTALNSNEQKIKGFSLGADDYITKPFNEEILLARVNGLLVNRKKIREYYLQRIDSITGQGGTFSIQPTVIEVQNPDEKFIMKIMQIVENHIGEVDFSVDFLAREIGMESSTLYKKMMAMIDMPPGEFIRDIRLKRAAQLLSQKHLSISDISYMIGYEEPKYFTKVFRKHYGNSPSEYRKNIFDSN
jgi:signal transduction histidine kinase/ligand-binding sensor domain-containing protein/AraC-like DNA-binding protein/ActR/RegA family two-component response regulator